MDMNGIIPCRLCGADKFQIYCTPGQSGKIIFNIVRCNSCGLYFIDPIPSASELASQYSQNYFSSSSPLHGGYEDYLKDEPFIKRTFIKRLQLLPEILFKKPNGA